MIGLLGIVMIYIFTVISYQDGDIQSTINKDVYLDKQNLIETFMYHLNYGIRSGGGVGDMNEKPQGETATNKRFYYDVCFFIFINVIWLNIIFGLIIDTFAQLRDEKNMREQELRGECFICGISRDEVESINQSFKEHIQDYHNVWNYFYYAIYINTKPNIDMNGTQLYINK